MKKRVFIFLMSGMQISAAQDLQDVSYLHDKRFNEVHCVEMHNVSLYKKPEWEYPSPTGNQNLTVIEALEYAKFRGAILSMKVPAHWTQELGKGEGKGPIMAAHGIYHNTFDADYFGAFSQLAKRANGVIESEFEKLDAIPGVSHAIAPLKDEYLKAMRIAFGYLYWSKPVAHMERVAREVTYGSDDKAALVPFTPCVIDPSAQPFQELLAAIKLFLESNRQQLAILKIENVTGNTEVIAQELHAAGLNDYAHKQDPNALWPTIGELVETNKRFIPFITTHVSEDDTNLNAEGDFIWSAHWNYQTKEELVTDHYVPADDSNYQRWESGKPVSNALYRLPCHLTQGFAGRPDLAQEVNTKQVITERMEAIDKGKPTFLALDFIDSNEGEGFAVVREWNEG